MSAKRMVVVVFFALLAWYWQKYIIQGPIYDTQKDLRGRTVLITGMELLFRCATE